MWSTILVRTRKSRPFIPYSSILSSQDLQRALISKMQPHLQPGIVKHLMFLDPCLLSLWSTVFVPYLSLPCSLQGLEELQRPNRYWTLNTNHAETSAVGSKAMKEKQMRLFSWGLDGNLPKMSNLISIKEKWNHDHTTENDRWPGGGKAEHQGQGRVIQIKTLGDLMSLTAK